MAYIQGVLNSTAASGRGAAVANILTAFSGLTSDVNFGTAATKWNAEVMAAAGNTLDADKVWDGVAAAPTSFSLTVGQDVIDGSAGNDTFKSNVLQKSTVPQVNS